MFISFIIIMIGLYAYAYFSPTLDLKNSGSLYIYDNNEELVYQGSKTNEWVNLDNISDDLKNAVISVEDKNFYYHQGFDYLRIAKAAFKIVKNRTIVEGASTISQQYIKNLYLDFDKSWSRKIEEAFLTLKLEVHYSKDDILEGYLNTINYGQGNYGIGNASMYYFNKKASELTLEEALMLAGIPKNPSNYNPVSDYDACISRAKIVAKTMVNNGYISEDSYNELFINKIEIYGKRTDYNLQMIMYYQDAVLKELETLKDVPKTLIDQGGLRIYTNLDMNAQKTLEENILKYIEDDNLQVASVVVNPENGAIMALTGGMDYSKSTYNRALSSKRQVGSTMKPFLYYAALENGMTMSSTFKSELTTFNLANGQTYTPTNYAERYANKEITMAAAIAFSDNVYAVKTNLFLGVDKMIEASRKAGIKGDLKEVPSLALGTSELNIIDFSTGYNTFATGGYYHDLYFISKVEDLNGNVLYEKKIDNELVLNPNDTFILNEMLTSTTNSAFKDYTTPSALGIASKLSRKYAIKTGTTDNDHWIVGYNPKMLISIWLGCDENEKTPSNSGTLEKNIWADTMETLLKDTDSTWYEKPENVIAIPLDSVTGDALTSQDKMAIYYYKKGTEPDASSYVNAN